MPEQDLVVGVAGATGALGKEILSVLDRAPWRPSQVFAYASAASTVPFVDWGGAQVAVDDLATADFDALDLLFVALPPDAAVDALERAVRADLAVVDCSGAMASEGEVPVVLPWVNPGALMDPPRGAVQVPGAAATLLASALGPLVRAGVDGVADATVMVPASGWGRDGIDELSRQVVSLFNSGTPPRRVFPDGLAFDLLPQVGELGPDGWTEAEDRVVDEVRALAGWTGPLRVGVVGVPVFSGISAELRVRPNRLVPVDLAHQILVDGGLKQPEGEGARYVPRPRRVEGQPFAQVGRLRADVDGGLWMWLSMDNLRASAAVAVASAGALVQAR